MRISALIDRLWTDILGQPWALGALTMVVMALALLAAVGLVVLARRIERAVRRFVAESREDRALVRRARLVTREPGRALAEADDRSVWREAPPVQQRPRCTPRHPDAVEIYGVIAAATRLCRQAAERRSTGGGPSC